MDKTVQSVQLNTNDKLENLFVFFELYFFFINQMWIQLI